MWAFFDLTYVNQCHWKGKHLICTKRTEFCSHLHKCRLRVTPISPWSNWEQDLALLFLPTYCFLNRVPKLKTTTCHLNSSEGSLSVNKKANIKSRGEDIKRPAQDIVFPSTFVYWCTEHEKVQRIQTQKKKNHVQPLKYSTEYIFYSNRCELSHTVQLQINTSLTFY